MASLNQGTNLQFFPYNDIVQSKIWVSYFVVFDVKEEEHSSRGVVIGLKSIKNDIGQRYFCN